MAYAMASAEWICSTEGIKNELILLVVGSTSELGTDDYLDLTSPLCSFAISNIFKRRCYYQRTSPEQRRRYVITSPIAGSAGSASRMLSRIVRRSRVPATSASARKTFSVTCSSESSKRALPQVWLG